jgi:hypothetical protein
MTQDIQSGDLVVFSYIEGMSSFYERQFNGYIVEVMGVLYPLEDYKYPYKIKYPNGYVDWVMTTQLNLVFTK